MQPLLSAANVTVRFGGITAIDDVSFDVRPGELLGLIGPNGAGKTTMMRAIVGIVRPMKGSVTLEGRRLDALSIDARIRAGLALSQQLVKPFREIDVQDNVAFAAGAAKTRTPLQAFTHVNRKAERDDRPGNPGPARHRGASPSRARARSRSGVLKRLEMARALALKPKLLLLDEPLAGLNTREARAPGGHHCRHQPARHDHHPDRAQPGRGDADLPAPGGAGQRPQDRGRTAPGHHERPGRPRRLPGRRSRCCSLRA